MLNILICDDDDVYTTRVIEKIVSANDYIDKIFIAHNGQEAVDVVMEQRVDVAILDIDMPVLDGLEAAKIVNKYNSDVNIIFATAYPDYAYNSYEIKALDYILKPIDFGRLKENLEKLVETIEASKFNKVLIHNKLLLIKCGQEYKFIDMDDINYVEKNKNQIVIKCVDKKYETSLKLGEVEMMLSTSFYRTHRSYIVNLNNADKFTLYGETSYLVHFKDALDDDTALITKNKIKNLKQVTYIF